MAEANIRYNGAIIATMTESGNKRLTTAGKYMESDVYVDFDGQGGGTDPKLRDVTITPTEQRQEVTAGAGYDGISKAVVEPIPNTYIGTAADTNIRQQLRNIYGGEA